MKRIIIILYSFSVILTLNTCKNEKPIIRLPVDFNAVAESYAKLCLQLDKYDHGFVDAYYGPKRYEEEVAKEKMTLDDIQKRADSLLKVINSFNPKYFKDLWRTRYYNMKVSLESIIARVDLVSGRQMSFEEEAKRIYDIEIPEFDTTDLEYEKILYSIDQQLPKWITSDFLDSLKQSGALEPDTVIESSVIYRFSHLDSLRLRYLEFRNKFIVPKDKIPELISTALKEARSRTMKFVTLPKNEKCVVEYVTNQPWGAYNWYKGNCFSLIQINTDLPIYIDQIVNYVCHEAYPGHHVYHSLRDKNYYRDSVWMEFTVIPLFAPSAVISEGLAQIGINTAFPSEERILFEQDVLFPLAGFDSKKVKFYYSLRELVKKFDMAVLETEIKFMEGRIDKEEAIKLLMKYQLNTRERAEKSLSFLEKYRAYIATYTIGEKLIDDYMLVNDAGEDMPNARRLEYNKLLVKPIIPSSIKIE
ncbi:MAG: hypothetical protein QG635_798 [Bacteroidota bacterium]|nr:hypothetical protein [Bacteroidota bacterium]